MALLPRPLRARRDETAERSLGLLAHLQPDSTESSRAFVEAAEHAVVRTRGHTAGFHVGKAVWRRLDELDGIVRAKPSKAAVDEWVAAADLYASLARARLSTLDWQQAPETYASESNKRERRALERNLAALETRSRQTVHGELPDPALRRRTPR